MSLTTISGGGGAELRRWRRCGAATVWSCEIDGYGGGGTELRRSGAAKSMATAAAGRSPYHSPLTDFKLQEKNFPDCKPRPVHILFAFSIEIALADAFAFLLWQLVELCDPGYKLKEYTLAPASWEYIRSTYSPTVRASSSTSKIIRKDGWKGDNSDEHTLVVVVVLEMIQGMDVWEGWHG
uniref:Uncharacterized protein n=1 Tax=Oryza barthii TaxID=65489 RepID=A0A0D3G3W3_9ORYZ